MRDPTTDLTTYMQTRTAANIPFVLGRMVALIQKFVSVYKSWKIIITYISISAANFRSFIQYLYSYLTTEKSQIFVFGRIVETGIRHSSSENIGAVLPDQQHTVHSTQNGTPRCKKTKKLKRITKNKAAKNLNNTAERKQNNAAAVHNVRSGSCHTDAIHQIRHSPDERTNSSVHV